MAKTYDIYKDSGVVWIGEIPSRWKVGLVGRYFDEIKNPNTNQEETNTLQFKMGNIISKKDGDSKYNPETIEAYNIVEPGTIMINGLNLSFDLISQRVAQVHEKGVITSTYLALKPKEGMKSDYAKYLLKAYDNNKALHAMGRGLRATLSYGTFRSEPVLVPSDNEQQSIAIFLDQKCNEIDSLISLQEEIISELQAYKQAVITEAVTKGLDPNAKMKDSGVEWIGEIPEGWDVKPFKYIFKNGKGLSFTKADLVNEGVPVISYGQVHSKQNKGTQIVDCLIRFVPVEMTLNSSLAKVHIGDFIFADTSEDLEGCGNCVYIDKEIGLYAGYHSVIAHAQSKSSNLYLAYLFLTNCWRSQIRSRVSGIKVLSISQSIINKTTVILPPLFEQQAITSYLNKKCEAIDSLISLKQQKIAKLKDYKKSIIYEYVTGKKRV